MSLVGKTIGDRYRVVRLLGRGAMGAVYEARHKTTERRLALKVIHERLAADETLVRRFLGEARAAGRIESQHVAQVVDADIDPQTHLPYLVMEFLQGEDLEALLAERGALDVTLALRIAVQACLGLEKAHDAGIVHRDIKPANLFVAERDGGERVVKVLDFGVAKLQGDDATNATLTRPGGVLGSPLYMSPEQARGSPDIDARTDVWAVGVVLYQMLTGKAPHAGIDILGDLWMAIWTKPAPPPTKAAPWVPESVDRVVLRALKIDRNERYPDIKALRADLMLHLPEGVSISQTSVKSAQKQAAKDSPTAPGEAAPIDVLARTEVGSGSGETEAAAGAITNAPSLLGTADFLANQGLAAATPAESHPEPSDVHAAHRGQIDVAHTDGKRAPAGARKAIQPSVDASSSPQAPNPAGATAVTPASSHVPLNVETTAPERPATATTLQGQNAGSWKWPAVASAAILGLVAVVLIQVFRPPQVPPVPLPLRTEVTAPVNSLTVTSAPVTSAPDPEKPKNMHPCADPRRHARSGQVCDAPARAWCDGEDRVLACCSMGLVPAGQEGACTCAPGGTHTQEALSAGCPKAKANDGASKLMQATIRAKYSEARQCYEGALGRIPAAKGTVAVYFEVGIDGQVLVAEVRNSSFPDAAAQTCLVQFFRRFVFAPPAEGHTTIVYPLALSPGD